MSTHRIEPARPKIEFHSAAWGTFASAFKKHRPNTEAPVLKSHEVDPTGDDVAPQQRGRNIFLAKERSDCLYVLCRNQRDLPRPISTRCIVIALDTVFGNQGRRLYLKQRLLSART
jgi:hypothetical protein